MTHDVIVVLAAAGSISAEHGIGQKNRDYLKNAKSPAELQLMAQIKRTIDPAGIMNPGKVLDACTDVDVVG